MNLLLGISDAAPAALHSPAVTAAAGLVLELLTGSGAFRQVERQGPA